MTEDESKKFEMRMDDESQDFQVQEEIDDSKVKKLSRRITRVSIIVPCLVIIMIVAAYLENHRFVEGRNKRGLNSDTVHQSRQKNGQRTHGKRHTRDRKEIGFDSQRSQ
jgi:hypothetical protein